MSRKNKLLSLIRLVVLFFPMCRFTLSCFHVQRNLVPCCPLESRKVVQVLCGVAQYKEYATHLDHYLKDACSRSADFVSRQAAYGEALGAFSTQAAAMSKYEEGPAASAFVELAAAAQAIATAHADAQGHVHRCALL
jgi:hypothetical protein